MALPPMHKRHDNLGREVKWCHYHERTTGESRHTHITRLEANTDVWEMRVRDLATNKELLKREGIPYEEASAYLTQHALVV